MINSIAVYRTITFNDGSYEKKLCFICNSSARVHRYCIVRNSWADKVYPDELIAEMHYSYECFVFANDVQVDMNIAQYEKLISDYEKSESISSHSCTPSDDRNSCES